MIVLRRCIRRSIPMLLYATIFKRAPYRHQHSTTVVLRPLHELRTVHWDFSVLCSCDTWTHRHAARLLLSLKDSRPYRNP